MRKFFIILLLILSSCYSFRERNKLAIPPIANNELSILNEANN
ncbi:MAG TPA: hypothetical protein VLL98_02330 [Rickettsiales bacterium]|nr:hypothetical protein [Rickettsiales bacterium]